MAPEEVHFSGTLVLDIPLIRNQYRNVYFSYDILGRPEEIKINFYLDKWDYRYNQKNFITVYSNENIEGMR